MGTLKSIKCSRFNNPITREINTDTNQNHIKYHYRETLRRVERCFVSRRYNNNTRYALLWCIINSIMIIIKWSKKKKKSEKKS